MPRCGNVHNLEYGEIPHLSGQRGVGGIRSLTAYDVDFRNSRLRIILWRAINISELVDSLWKKDLIRYYQP